MAQAVRYGMMVTPEKSATLDGGQWDFPGYSDASYIGQANRLRLEALKVAQRIDGINVEQKLAKSTGRSPKIPDPVARQALIKKDRDTVEALRKSFDNIESKIFEMEVKLQPFDYESPTVQAAVRDSTVNAQLRSQLLSAKDDKERAKLLELAPYRRAAFEAPAEASGVGKLAYDRMRQEDIARRYPVETKTIADFRKAESIMENVMKTVDAGVKFEMVASGAASIEQQQNLPEPQSSAWA